jgi:tetratricopeptide (TPR) repeat protein
MRTLHLRFAIGLLLTLCLVAIGVYVLHEHQLSRIATDLRSQVEQARDADKIDDAIRLAYQYLDFQPDDAGILVELAGWMESRGSGPKHLAFVAAVLDRALQIDPTRSDLRRRVVAIELQLGQWSECLDHLERLLPGSPNDPELLANLGVCQEAIARHSEAAASFEKSLKADPKRVATSLAYSALLHRHLHRPEDARRVLNACVALNPDAADARLGLARFLKSIGKYSEAVATAKEAVALAPKDRTTLTAAADIEQAAGHYSAARGYLSQARELNPNDARLACSLAWLLLCDGKSADAIATLEAVLKDHPDDADSLTLLGDILALDGRIDALKRIVGELGRLRQVNPASSWNADYLQSRLLIRKNDFAGAARLLEELRLSSARRPGLAIQANYLQAQCYEQLHDRPSELEAFRRIFDADPQAGYFRLEYARSLARAGDFPTAVKEFRTALQKPNLPVRTVLEVAGELADRCRRFGGEASLKELERGLESVRADDANVNVVLAKVELMHRRQKTGDALRLTQQYLQRHKNQVEVLALQARLIDSYFGPNRAVATLAESERQLGDQAEFRMAKLRLLATRPDGAGSAAFSLAADVDKFNPEDRSRILAELVAACGSTGNVVKLVESLERLRAVRADHLAVRSALLSHALATGNQSEVNSLLSEVAGIEGRDGKAARQFDVERSLSNRELDGARSQLDSLARSFPGDPVVLFLIGRIEELTNNRPTALNSYSMSLSAGLLDLPVEMLMAGLAIGDATERKVSVFVEESPLFDRLRLDLDRPLIQILLPLATASARPGLADRLINGNSMATAPELVWFGGLAQHLGLSRHAEAAFARATTIAPLSEEAWAARLTYHSARQDMAKVQELIAQAKRTLPANEGTIILARALETAGLRTEAMSQVQAAVAIEPANIDARRQLVQQLSQTGRIAEARQQLQSMINQPGISDQDAVWARRTLAVNLTASPSLDSFRTSVQLLESNKNNGTMADEDLRALATVFAAQRARPIADKTARQEAIGLLNQIKARQSEDLILLARLYRYEGEGSNYLQVITQLEQEYANDFSAQFYLAQETLHNDELSKADRHIAVLQRLDAARFETLVATSTRLALAGQGETAKSVLEQYIRNAPDGPPRFARQVRCGHAAFEMLTTYPLADQPASATTLRQAAIEWYRAGLGRDPQALLHLVILLCRSGLTSEALELLQAPGIRAAFSIEAQAAGFATAARQGDANAQQLQFMERLLKTWNQKHPGSVALQLALADLYEAQKQVPKAVFIYRDLLQRDGDNMNALNNLAWTSLGDPAKMAEAQRMIGAAIDRHGQLDELLDTRGRLLFADGKQAEGLRDLHEAALGSPSAARYFQLAVLHRRANQPEAAAAALRQSQRFGLTPADVLPQDVADYREMTSSSPPRTQ